MKKYLCIFVFMYLIFAMPVFAQDSTGIAIGKWGRAEVNYVNFVLMMKSPPIVEGNNTKISAYPYLLTGAELMLKYIKYNIGISGAIMFGTDEDVLNTIPAMRVKVFSVSGGIGYILGNVPGEYKNERQRRLCFMLSFNPLEIFK